MKRVYCLAVTALLVLWSATSAYSAPSAKAKSPSYRAKATLEEVEARSASISEDAFALSEMAKEGGMDLEAHSEGLNRIRENVNRVGRDLQSLEADRGSLSAWEIRTLDQVAPLLHEVADNTGKAIKTFTPEVAGPSARSYVQDTSKIAKYAEEAKILLLNHMKLEKTQEKERRIEHSLGEAAGS